MPANQELEYLIDLDVRADKGQPNIVSAKLQVYTCPQTKKLGFRIVADYSYALPLISCWGKNLTTHFAYNEKQTVGLDIPALLNATDQALAFIYHEPDIVQLFHSTYLSGQERLWSPQPEGKWMISGCRGYSISTHKYPIARNWMAALMGGS